MRRPIRGATAHRTCEAYLQACPLSGWETGRHDVRTLITCGRLVTMDPDIGDLTNAELLIEDNRILEINTRSDPRGTALLPTQVSYDEHIDASEMLVMPGLTDAHVHLWQSSMRGIGVEWMGADYFQHMYFNMGNRYDPRDNYLGNLLGALAYIDNGVTTILDYSHNIRSLEMAEASIDALTDSGIRALFAHSPAAWPDQPGEPPFSHTPHPRERVLQLRNGRLADDDGRVRLALGLIGPHWGTREVVEDGLRLARELGVLGSSHATHPNEATVWPGGYLALARAGLLGPDHNIVHANYIDDEELRAILNSGASVTSTVRLEQHVGWPEPAVRRVREFGGTPSLGVDVPSMIATDIFRELRAALAAVRSAEYLARQAAGSPPPHAAPVPAREALEWATIGNARAMGLSDDIGRLAPGRKADLVMLRTEDLNLYPVFDSGSAIVELAGPQHVDTVIIDGHVRKRAGKLVYDAELLARHRHDLQESVRRIFHDAGFPHPHPASAPWAGAPAPRPPNRS